MNDVQVGQRWRPRFDDTDAEVLVITGRNTATLAWTVLGESTGKVTAYPEDYLRTNYKPD